MDEMTFETYLRQQADESQYGLMVVQTQIALDIANWIERKRNNEPSPERKKGEWIKMSDADGTYWCCSECGEELYRSWSFNRDYDLFPEKTSIDKTNFCPSCGADMRERKEE